MTEEPFCYAHGYFDSGGRRYPQCPKCDAAKSAVPASVREPKPNVCAAHGVNWCEVCMTDVAFQRRAAVPAHQEEK